MDVQIAGGFVALDQVRMNRIAHLLEVCFVTLAFQMFAASPHQLNGIMLRSQRKGLKIESRRACSTEGSGQKGCLGFGQKAEERCAKRKQFKQVSECRIQGSCIPRPVI